MPLDKKTIRTLLLMASFPNDEVGEGFMKYLLPFYSSVGENKTDFYVASFINDVEKGRPDSFMERLQAMLAGSDYRVAGDMEKYFQNVMYIVFRLMGFLRRSGAGHEPGPYRRGAADASQRLRDGA